MARKMEGYKDEPESFPKFQKHAEPKQQTNKKTYEHFAT